MSRHSPFLLSMLYVLFDSHIRPVGDGQGRLRGRTWPEPRAKNRTPGPRLRPAVAGSRVLPACESPELRSAGDHPLIYDLPSTCPSMEEEPGSSAFGSSSHYAPKKLPAFRGEFPPFPAAPHGGRLLGTDYAVPDSPKTSTTRAACPAETSRRPRRADRRPRHQPPLP